MKKGRTEVIDGAQARLMGRAMAGNRSQSCWNTGVWDGAARSSSDLEHTYDDLTY